MPVRIFDTYCREEGFCCPYALLKARERWSTWALAEDSGVSRRGVRYHRKEVRLGRCVCAQRADCMLAIDKPLEYPHTAARTFAPEDDPFL